MFMIYHTAKFRKPHSSGVPGIYTKPPATGILRTAAMLFFYTLQQYFPSKSRLLLQGLYPHECIISQLAPSASVSQIRTSAMFLLLTEGN
jgi:hypothetical protein